MYRDAAPEDSVALAALARETFVATFGHLYPATDLNAFCDRVYSPEAQAALIVNAEVDIRLAARAGALVGYGHVGQLSLPFDPGARRALELHRLYVAETAKGAGVAAALMDWALARMRARGAEDAYLGVWKNNARALAFYRRSGFEIVGEYLFPPIGPTPDEEFIMRRALT